MKPIAALAAIAFACVAPIAIAQGPGDALDAVHEVGAGAVETLTGTVTEFAVDDTTRGTSQRYVELQLDDGSLVPLRGAAAERLANGVRVEVSGRHRGKPLQVDTARPLARGRAPETKSLVEADGTLAILHADYFEDDKSAFVYEVHEQSGRVRRLRMGSMPAALEPGARVRVRGRAEADDGSVTPESITILHRPVASSDTTDGGIVKAATASSVLVIMANFSNTTAPALSSAQAQQVMTSNSDSVVNFYRENSYGQQILNVTVTPEWLRMSIPQPGSCSTTDWRAIGASAEAAARSLGSAYDPATYNFVVYVFPQVPACGWLGLAYIGSPRKSWINGPNVFRTSTIAHEMGHNFGLLHAASLSCSGAPIGGSCASSEYGDPFDAMGNQRAMHFNAMQKSKLAWIPSTSVQVHSGGTATYTLGPLEVSGVGSYAVKVPTGAANRTYWLEFRQPIGFDSPLASYPNNGAQVRVAYPFETQCGGCDSYSDDTQLLDMTPSTSTFNDATLLAGQTFSDPTHGINVTVLSATAGALTVQVGTGGAPPPPPTQTATTTSLASTANPSITGRSITLTGTVNGNAPTGSVRFTDDGVTIVGCGAVGLAGSGNVRTASCNTNALITGSHSLSASYGGDAANLPSTSAVLTQVMNAPVNGTNVALATNGGVATASSTNSAGFLPGTVIDDKRSGAGWGSGAGWNDATLGAFPDWIQIDFDGVQPIDHAVVYSVQDNYLNPVEPADATTFTLRGVTDFLVQGFDGANWVTLATVSGNNLVKRTVSFAPYSTSRLRIYITHALGNWTRLTEVEAWTSSASIAKTNVALASNGGVATASSSHSAGFAPATVIDNKRSGAGWGSGAGWNDATFAAFPDWIEVNFNGVKSIDRAVLYSVQDNYLNPVEPSDALTFSLRGITDFLVQGFNGSTWVTLAAVSGNDLVKRSVTFAPYATDRIRFYITNALANWTRVTEVEAWGN